MLRLLPETHFPFISWRRYAYVVTLIVLLPGMASLVLKGGPRYGIDFTGGTLVQLRFEREVPLDRLRARLAAMGLESFELQRFGDPREVVVRAKGELGEEAQLAARIAQTLEEDSELRENPFEVVRVEAVGPKIGSELQRKALLALVFSCLFIVAYIYIRFKGLKYGIAPVIALVHDALVTVGVFSLLNKEISLDVVAALLTVIGYSVNDSIVVLDRIRENLRTRHRLSLPETIDKAINQTLSRTVITGLSTLFVVLGLFFVGGQVIHNFAFALLVGILVGTYSSIFVVAPLLVEWERFFGRRAAPAPAEPATRTPPAPTTTARPAPSGRATGSARRRSG